MFPAILPKYLPGRWQYCQYHMILADGKWNQWTEQEVNSHLRIVTRSSDHKADSNVSYTLFLIFIPS
jgi:hypothetical protein